MASKPNLGPRAAASNRAALVAAARDLFAERGIDAPLSAIAQRAGVGQGSLYRHFPTREDLALAVFDANLAEVEALAARPESTLREVTDLVTHQLEGSADVVGFAALGEDARLRGMEARTRAALGPKVDAAVAAGELDADIEDVMGAVGMIAALVTRTPAHLRHAQVERAWDLLMRGLSPRA